MKSYHKNPRQVTKKRLDRLTDTLARLGDLGGIVHNMTTDEIIGGNQRSKVFGEASKVEIVDKLKKPDKQGTIAHGFIIWRGGKYAYRQVKWDEATAAEANVAANINAGTWDADIFANQWDAKALTEWGFDRDMVGSLYREAEMITEMFKELGVETLEWGDAADGLPGADRAPFQQVTFTLHDDQVEEVQRAIMLARKMDLKASKNANINGNALAHICAEFNTSHVDG